MKRLNGAIALALVLAVALASGCETAGDGDGTGNASDLGTMQAALQAFESCDEVRDYLHEVVIAEMDEAIAMYEQCEANGEWCGYYAYDMAVGAPTNARGGAGGEWADDGMDGGAAPPTSPTTGGDQGSGDSGAPTPDPTEPRSDTNTQEEGVDEADIVKSDAEYLYLLNGNKLRIVRATPVVEMGLAGNATIEGSPIEMFLSGDRLAVFSSEWRYASSGGSDGGGAEPPKAEPGDVGEPMPAEPTEPAMGGGSDGGSDGSFDERQQALTVDDLDLEGQILKITVFDVSDRMDPQVVRETWLEAGYVSSRMVGSEVHVVTNAYPTLPQLDWYGCVDVDDRYTDGGGGTTEPAPMPDDRPAVDAGTATGGGSAADAGSADPEPIPTEPQYEERQEALNEGLRACREEYLGLLAETDLADMMPQRVDLVAGGEASTENLVSCGTFYHPSVTMGLGILAVVSFDLEDDGGALASTGILGSSNTVYASADTLYVATYLYDYWRWERAAIEGGGATNERTAVHAFDITGAPRYVASGFVDGEVLNQFSMSEHEGNLRIATTMRNWNAWGPMAGGDVAVGVATSSGGAAVSDDDVADVEPDPEPVSDEPLDSTDNLVTVLGRDGDQLVEIGKLTGLGEPDERIFAARFFGDIGYVVTFRQMDPLYVIDLSDPTAPAKRGELHVPGFSSYIHPLGEDHLLTIGRGSTNPDEPTWTDGLKLSVYDVSDRDAPAEVDSLVVPASSEAQYNHKAFTYFEHLSMLAIPIDAYWWYDEGDAPLNGLALFRVDAATGVEQVGSISHADLVPAPEDITGEDGWVCHGSYLPQVRRGVFVGDRVYSISNVGVKANETTGDLAELNAVAFPDDAGMWDEYGWGFRECWMEEPGVEPEPQPDEGDGGDEEVPPEDPDMP